MLTVPTTASAPVRKIVAGARWVLAVSVWIAALAADANSVMAHYERRDLPASCQELELRAAPWALAVALTALGWGASSLQYNRRGRQVPHAVIVGILLVAALVQTVASIVFAMARPDGGCFD